VTTKIIQELEQEQMKPDLPEFGIGDTVEVRVKIVEGDKERTQAFAGTVIGRQGTGLRETFCVRRIVQGEGVERVFPLHSPTLLGLTVKRKGQVRRAKLYFLRQRVGKAARIKGRRVMESKQAKPVEQKAGAEGAGK